MFGSCSFIDVHKKKTTPTVDGLHPPRFVSEEPEAFGSLKRAMRGLRPSAEERLGVRRVTEKLRIHVYRRAQGENGDGETRRLGFSLFSLILDVLYDYKFVG